MTKPKEKKNEIIPEWIPPISLLVILCALVASLTTYTMMLSDTTPDIVRPEPCIDCCSGSYDCNNDVRVDVELTPINYTIHCSIEHSGGITYLYVSNHTGQPSMMFAQGGIQHKTIEDKNNIYYINKPYLYYNTQHYYMKYFKHHIEKMLEIYDKDPHEVRLICDAIPKKDYKFNYTVWDEGYHETRELIIHPPEFNIDCIANSHQCQDKCSIIDTCMILKNGRQLSNEILERELNDQIWNAIEDDIRR